MVTISDDLQSPNRDFYTFGPSLLAVVSLYLSLTAVANYHGYESGLIDDLEARIQALFPDVWNTVSPA